MLAGECRLAARRGDDSPEALVGAMLETEADLRLSAFLTGD